MSRESDTATTTATKRICAEDAELLHIVCCQDDNVLLCGVDGSKMHWGGPEPECIVCAEIEDGQAARGDCTGCPRAEASR